MMLLLIGTAGSQLSPDRERFDIELHPGEMIEKTLTLTNIGDKPVEKIDCSPVGGKARDLILIDISDFESLDPEDDEDISIIFAISPETEPGTYPGIVYIFDDASPSMPLAIEFWVLVTKEDSYGVSLSVNDASETSVSADPDEPMELDLLVRNTGRFRDVISLDIQSMPPDWSAVLFDDEDPVDLPYDLPLPSGTNHPMTLQIQGTPSSSGDVLIAATSMGNRSKNATIVVTMDVALEVQGYDVKIDMPEKMVANRTYDCSFGIVMWKKEKVSVMARAPPGILVIPLSQLVSLKPKEMGTTNFSIMPTEPGDYVLRFEMVDSKGVPIPPEEVTIEVVEPSQMVIITADDLVYTSLASLASFEEMIPVVAVNAQGLGRAEIDEVKAHSQVVILGNSSIVSPTMEQELSGPGMIRIAGDDLWQTSWLFAAHMWRNGTSTVVISGPGEMDVFWAYTLAERIQAPLIIWDSSAWQDWKQVAQNLTEREVGLEEALLVGDIDMRILQDLEEMGIRAQEVV